MSATLPHVERRYPPSERPALTAQLAEWQQSRPLAGKSVLAATPVFHNTLVAHQVLLAAGAELSVGVSPDLPRDDVAVAVLRKAGVAVLEPAAASQRTFDTVIDCAGVFRHSPSRYGYVELTRSGADYYRDSSAPVVLADAGRIKRIETELGTSDGFLRALAHFGFQELAGRRFVVFGGGKVGSGIARRCNSVGAHVIVVDQPSAASPTEGWHIIDPGDPDSVRSAIATAWCVVSATGGSNALAQWAPDLLDSSALLANMGVADEFGPAVPADRVLHGKVPLNFALTEPTEMRYLDPILALVNAAAVALVAGSVPNGMHPPSTELEQEILSFLIGSAVAKEGQTLFEP
jgi:adenosylhomocysteinase